MSENRAQKPSLIVAFASKYGVEPNKLMETLKATAFRQKEDVVITDAQMMALLLVANEYNLNPFTREIFAFPDKNNGIVPVVGVDGWSRIINERPELDGIEFRYSDEGAQPGDAAYPGLTHASAEWIECVIYRKDRRADKPVVVREFLVECYKPPYKPRGANYEISGPWQTHTMRFLRHKALIQCARLAFGFAGIYDEDEAQRVVDAQFTETKATPQAGGTAGLKTAITNQPGEKLPPMSVQQPDHATVAAGAAASGNAQEARRADPPPPATDDASASGAQAQPASRAAAKPRTDQPALVMPAATAPVADWIKALADAPMARWPEFVEQALAVEGMTEEIVTALNDKLDELTWGKKRS